MKTKLAILVFLVLALSLAAVVAPERGEEQPRAVGAGPSEATLPSQVEPLPPRPGAQALGLELLGDLEAFDPDGPPEGMRVHTAPDELNVRARTTLGRAFGPGGAGFLDPQLFGRGVIAGPYLWTMLGDVPEVVALDSRPIEILIPQQDGAFLELEARGFLAEDVPALAAALDELYPALAGAEVHGPRRDDYALYWTMIPYDIEEPLLMLERQGLRLIFDFDQDGRVFWVDDYSE